METAQALAARYRTTPLQGNHLKDVEALMAEATEVEPAFHAATKKLIESAGGRLQQGPLKKKDRVIEKMENDYGGNHLRVVDIVRDTGVFGTMAELLIAVQVLLMGQVFEIVRFKNRLPGNSYGYRDLMMSLKLAGSEHVCELQLHLQSIIDIKPGPSRCESQHLKRNMR